MKIFLSIALLLNVALLMAQTAKVPEAATAKFASMYPDIKNAKWDKEDGAWEASFKQNGTDMSANFDDHGNLLETETDIAMSSLPKAVTDYVSQHMPGKKIKEAAIITKPDGSKWYEVEINGKDYLFDKDGKPKQ